jgi:hypothetical protein
VGAPAVNFYANDVKITAVTSASGTEATTGTSYGSVGSGGFYAAIEPGQYTFAGKITATVDKDLAIATITATLEDGRNYSFYLSGFYSTTAKTVDGFVVRRFRRRSTTTGICRFVRDFQRTLTLFANTATSVMCRSVGQSSAPAAHSRLCRPVVTIWARLFGRDDQCHQSNQCGVCGGKVYNRRAWRHYDHVDDGGEPSVPGAGER